MQPAAQLLAAAALEQNPRAELAQLPGYTPAIGQALAPAQALLRAIAPPPGDDSALARFWHGLGQLAAGQAGARDTLADPRPLAGPILKGLRRYYQGLAAAVAGDADAAIELWQQGLDVGQAPAHLRENLAVLVFQKLASLERAGDLAGAAALALRSASLPSSAAFDELRLLTLDRDARAAAEAGDWARAAELWEAARQVLAASAKLGSPRPLLHNLALAYERQERWEDAAEAWRAMLRTRPRQKAKAAEPGQLSEQQWSLARARIIECYKHAGRPDLAVAVFRQAIKEAPNDLELRLQLADALLANQQQRAAANEIDRILAIDAKHADALLRRAALYDADGYLAMSEAVLRELVADHPERDDLRRAAALLFLDHGRRQASWENFNAALEAFAEGERYDPTNYLFPLNQARMLLARRSASEIGPLIERATELVGDNVEAFENILETWAMADQIDAARALLARMERTLQLDGSDYASLGITVLLRVNPPPEPLGLFGMFGVAREQPKPAQATAWTELATELIEQGVALEPANFELVGGIANDLMLARPDLALRYAEAAARLAPELPEAQIVLGIAQGMNHQVRPAKATLQRAAQLAAKQGKHSLAAQARQMRSSVGTPYFRASIAMSMSELDPGGFDDEIDLDDLGDIFG